MWSFPSDLGRFFIYYPQQYTLVLFVLVNNIYFFGFLHVVYNNLENKAEKDHAVIRTDGLIISFERARGYNPSVCQWHLMGCKLCPIASNQSVTPGHASGFRKHWSMPSPSVLFSLILH